VSHDGTVSRTVVPPRDLRGASEPLRFPSDSVERARIPDDAVVWVFSDIHGVRSGLVTALIDAGLIDIDEAWIAPPGTALVGLGDFIDRGADSAGVISLLLALQQESAAAGSRVVLVRGNHEQMLIDLLHGDQAWAVAWLAKGGDEALRSFGLDADIDAMWRLRADAEAAHPELAAFILDTLPYAVWRDTLLVHAAPPPGIERVADLAMEDAQMWHASAFLASTGLATDPGLAGYRADGIRRVVMGHVPQPDGPTLLHDGTALLLDTNASAPVKRAGEDWRSYATIVRLGTGPTFHDTETIMIDTSAAPDRAPARRAPARRTPQRTSD